MDLAAPSIAPAEPRDGSAGTRPTAALEAFAPHACRVSDLIGASPPPPFSADCGGRA